MGPSSSEFPDLPYPPLDRARGALSDHRAPAEAFPLEESAYPRPLRVPAQAHEPKRRYIILFLLTVVTTSLVGAGNYASFLSNFGLATLHLSLGQLVMNAFWYSGSILAILGAHEFGHYFACRYYGVNASLPYFLPLPPPFFTGTLGAVIRIREPITTKRALFDIGIAGPIAGFLVAVPILLTGMHLSTVAPLPPRMIGWYNLGEPLLFQVTRWLTFGPIPAGSDVNLHPMAFAAWFGLLATAINLFPIGQLDGGHISYAVLGGRISTAITVITVACLVGLTLFVSWSWVVWTVITTLMLIVFGPRHPRTMDEHVPIDRSRLGLAVVALLMFIVCFTPAPMEPINFVRPRPRPPSSQKGLQVQAGTTPHSALPVGRLNAE
jgi:Zn-dependent protease